MPVQIERYTAAWSFGAKSGTIKVFWAGGTQYRELRGLGDGEFLTVLDVLRNEEPLHWDDSFGGQLFTHYEAPGEGER